MFRFLLSFIITFLILTHSAYSQSVGVVMSGGGAKGLYHIGVLQALEDNEIPIDYITGTSMGAIVGSFYAAGYSPQEIADIAISGKLTEWMSGRIESNYGAYFREYTQVFKDDPILSVRIDTHSPNKTFHLPRGIIPSIKVDMALSSYLAPATAASHGNFDKLMIPFACVASDIKSRERVVFKNGDLGVAVRASMALPVAFKPVVKDSMILYDGGISDNFPWQPMIEEFNPDIMIGISCSTGNSEPKDELSMIDNILLLTMNKTEYNMPEDISIKIDRDVNNGTLDFAQAAKIINLGYDDTMLKIDSIKQRIVRRTTREEFASRRIDFREKSPELIFDEFEVTGLDSNQLQYVYNYMETNRRRRKSTQNNDISFDDLKRNLYSILSSNDFSTDYPTITYDEISQRYKFSIKITNKPLFKLSLGGNISSTAFNQLYFSVDYRHIGTSAKTAYAEVYLGPVYTTGVIGGRIDTYKRAPLFLDAYACYSSKNLRHGNFGLLTEVSNTLEMKNNEGYLSMGVGFPISKRAMFSVRSNMGVENYKYDAIEPKTSLINSAELIDQTKLQFAAVKGEIERITFDKSIFPTKGSKLTISSIFLYGKESNYRNTTSTKSFETIPKLDHSWYGVRLRYDKCIISARANSWFSMGLNIDGVFTNVDEFATSTATSLTMPTYQPTLHSKMIFMPEYSAKYYAAGGLIPKFTLYENLYAQAGIYTMFRETYVDSSGNTPVPIGNLYSLQFISDLSILYHTRMGVLSLALSKYGLSNTDNMYLTFNFGYSIFTPKGTFY